MKRNARGISLLEVLVGLSILAVAFLALLEIFPMANMAVHRGKDQLVATQLAQGFMDEMRSRSYDAMASMNVNASIPYVVNSGNGTQSYEVMLQVLPEPAGTPLNQSDSALVRVHVQWRQRGQGPEKDAQGALRVVVLESTRSREL